MNWLKPSVPSNLRIANTRTHYLDEPLQKRRPPKEPKKYQALEIGGRTYKSINAAAKQFRRHHSVIEGWLRTGKAKAV